MNKNLILSLIFGVLSSFIYSQNISIKKANANYFESSYLISEMENIVSVFIENTKCDDIHITSKNGNVEKMINCNFKILPKKGRTIKLDIFKITHQDTVFQKTKEIRLKDNFIYKSTIIRSAKTYDSEMSIKEFKDIKFYVGAYPKGVICYDYNKSLITQYRLILLRSNEVIGNHLNSGSEFDQDALKLLQKVKIGDKLHFVDIYMNNHKRTNEFQLNALSLSIVE